MAAYRLWLALILELMVYAAILVPATYVFSLHATTILTLVVVLMLLTRLAIVMATCIFARAVQRTMPALSIASWMRLVALEAMGLARVQFLILIDSLGLRPRQRSKDCDPNAPLVILVHGIYCAGAIWRPILRALVPCFRCEFVAPSLTPTSSHLLSQADCFDKWLQSQCDQASGRRIIVIAHSMGGLVLREYLSRSTSMLIDTLVCVSTPFRGSRLAQLLRTSIGKDLRPGSEVIEHLQHTPLPSHTRITTITSAHDNMVIPASSALLAGKNNIAANEYGHLSLLYSKRLRQILKDQLQLALTAASEDVASEELPHTATE